ncbi:uncharacterized protein STAUR_3679 [Stigmatella aurantiaca DW4/3-1]|uniref:Immunity protein 52 domain-containing protein n=1 Tax=Stigmatella aurantiaca (strain DW4/3-1) TaxID=378806 RepID=E3FFA0_STIAD|nr:Imm52 family immunity protein [Stigmatella aurantiaca]ADO71467.1 uncharacterized protein STAUR_3679 [Stigmatella aurantiaca DW4/3-1]
MLESYYAGVYWGSRRENVSECAQRTALFFSMLSQSDPSLKQWYKAGKGKVPKNFPGQTAPVDNANELERLLTEEMNRATIDKSAIEELGFGLHVWNQRPDSRSTRVHIQCGGYANMVGNHCLVDPPSEGDAMNRLMSEPVLIQLLECLATA